MNYIKTLKFGTLEIRKNKEFFEPIGEYIETCNGDIWGIYKSTSTNAGQLFVIKEDE